MVPTTRGRGHVSITARWIFELWMSCNKEKSSADASLQRERVGTRRYSVHYGHCRVDMLVLFGAIFAQMGDFRQSYQEPLVVPWYCNLLELFTEINPTSDGHPSSPPRGTWRPGGRWAEGSEGRGCMQGEHAIGEPSPRLPPVSPSGLCSACFLSAPVFLLSGASATNAR